MRINKLLIITLILTIGLTSCDSRNYKTANSKLESYSTFVDSVSKLPEFNATKRWKEIEKRFENLKKTASKKINILEDNINLKNTLDSTTLKFEKIKARIEFNNK